MAGRVEAMAALGEIYAPATDRLIITAIDGKSRSISGLSREIGVSKETVRKRLVAMHRMGVIHVSAWKRMPSGHQAPFYLLGKGTDAKPTERLSSAQKTARWRAKGNDSHRARKLANPPRIGLWGM